MLQSAIVLTTVLGEVVHHCEMPVLTEKHS